MNKKSRNVNKKKRKGSLLICLGLLLLAAALLLTGYNLREESAARQSAGEAAERLEEILAEETEEEETMDPEELLRLEENGEIEIPDYILNPKMEMPAEEIDGQAYIGVLKIPALELELPVLRDISYPKLKIAPCRYLGSAYTADLIIAAHNYPSHFGNLKQLLTGDQLLFTDTDGNQFVYEVEELELLGPGDIEEMESGDWDLTLFTCTIGGQSRVTVRCKRCGSVS